MDAQVKQGIRFQPLLLAIGFFAVWLSILYAGADHPPPWGFLWFVLLDAIAACMVYVRMPQYMEWACARERHRFIRAMLDGIVVGLLFAFIARILPVDRTGTPEPDVFALFIWYAVLAVVGMANSCGIYVVSALLSRN